MVRVASRRLVASLLVLGVLSGCGGGDSGSGSGVPAQINKAPSFTSATTASVAENSSTPFYNAAATDADGDTVTIAITGGSDSAAFSFAGGVLAFARAPNYDQPTDANLDNTYEVTLTATDGKGGSTTLTLPVRVTNDHEGVNLTRLTSGLGTDAVIAARISGSDGLIVVSQDGTVREFFGGDATGNLSGNVFEPGETGRVLAVAHFNGYGVAMLQIAGVGVIVRTIVLQDSILRYVDNDVLAGPSTEAARGTLFIGGDGFLFGALGDPSGGLAQDVSSGYGKLYRVQIDPYCGASFGSYCLFSELFGDGIHSPAGGGGYASRSFLLDSGTDQQEEVDYFFQDARPLDFGWPFREGTYVRVANPPAAVIGPSITYTYGDGFFQGQRMTGGVHYRGNISSLDDRILITDRSGKIFAFRAGFLSDGILHAANEMENRTADFAPADGTIERPTAIVRDTAGRLFVLDGDGELYVAR